MTCENIPIFKSAFNFWFVASFEAPVAATMQQLDTPDTLSNRPFVLCHVRLSTPRYIRLFILFRSSTCICTCIPYLLVGIGQNRFDVFVISYAINGQ